jgi:hypothetical protein
MDQPVFGAVWLTHDNVSISRHTIRSKLRVIEAPVSMLHSSQQGFAFFKSLRMVKFPSHRLFATSGLLSRLWFSFIQHDSKMLEN